MDAIKKSEKIGDKKVYMEDTNIFLPACKYGVTALGDLWNCVTSTTTGFNLLNNKPEREDVTVAALGSDSFKFQHLKNESNKLDLLDVKAELKLELLAGLIKVKGAAGFNDKKKIDEYLETIVLKKEYENSKITLKYQDEKISKNIKDKLMLQEIKATHIVNEITIGAIIDASITESHSINESSQNIKGQLKI
jgi:hypothetical protein